MKEHPNDDRLAFRLEPLQGMQRLAELRGNDCKNDQQDGATSAIQDSASNQRRLQ